MNHRVVVTGMGAVTPIGIGLEAFWDGLKAGRNGIGRLTRFDPEPYRSQMAGEVRGFDPETWMDAKAAKRMDLVTQYGVAASLMALCDAGIEDGTGIEPTRAGVMIGSGIGGSHSIESGYMTHLEKGPRALSPVFITMVLVNMTACVTSIRVGFKGPVGAPSAACATGLNAIGDAMRLIQRGDADVMLAGSAEACITPVPYGGFCASRSMSSRNDCVEKASRPFDRNRDGFVMGEGAGVVVLERLEHAVARGARIYAEAAGYASTADAYHITAPDPEGDGMIRAMRGAVTDAGLEPEAVGHVNAHGTSTPLNDKTESMAIQRVFGEHAGSLKVSSIKSMVGHLMAASGSAEFVATAMSVYEGIVPPTINYEEADPECPLDYVTKGAESLALEAAITNSFGFGGCNACMAVRRYAG